MPTIAFVCTANRFRSPLAAACFRKELQERQMDRDWHVLSLGTWGTGRLPAATEVVQYAGRLGQNISGHASHGVHPEHMLEADAVIVMEQGQREALQIDFPEFAHKVYLLSEVTAGQTFDVPDPLSRASAAEVTREIEQLIHEGFEKICALVGQTPQA